MLKFLVFIKSQQPTTGLLKNYTQKEVIEWQSTTPSRIYGWNGIYLNVNVEDIFQLDDDITSGCKDNS